MLTIPPLEDFQVGDFVKFINQIDNDLYGVIIELDEGRSLDYPYNVRLTSGHTIWMSEWDMEKVA
jgi:hypothetical protein